MPIATDRPFQLNPVKVDAEKLNPRDVFQWYTGLGKALRNSTAYLNMQDSRDLSERMFIVDENGAIKTFPKNVTEEQMRNLRVELYTAAMAGRLMCYPLGQTTPVQILTDGKKDFSLSRPWQAPQIPQPQPPRGLNWFQRAMNNFFGLYKAEKAEADRQMAEYRSTLEQIAAASLLEQGTQQANTRRMESDLFQEEEQRPQRALQQTELDRAERAQKKYNEISNAPYTLRVAKDRLRPEFSERIGDKTVVRTTAEDIYVGTAEYKRREAAMRKAEAEKVEPASKDSLDDKWYADQYLELTHGDFVTLGMLACASLTDGLNNDPLWASAPELARLNRFDALMNTFVQGEAALYTAAENEYMYRGRNLAVTAVNQLQGNLVMEPNSEAIGKLITEGLKVMCGNTMKSGDYTVKDAASVSMIRNVLSLLDRSEPLMQAAMDHGLDETLLTEARGLVVMGDIMERGYQARADLYNAIAENSNRSPAPEMVARIQAMRMVQEDMHRAKQYRNELLEDINLARQDDDAKTAAEISENLLSSDLSPLHNMLGACRSPEPLYTALKAHPGSQKLLELSMRDLQHQLMSPVTDTLLHTQVLNAVQPPKREIQPPQLQHNVPQTGMNIV